MTWPEEGFSTLDRARSKVDLPQALGPTTTVNESGGMDSERFSEMADGP